MLGDQLSREILRSHTNESQTRRLRASLHPCTKRPWSTITDGVFVKWMHPFGALDKLGCERARTLLDIDCLLACLYQL
jgi:hypothetical protein